MEFVSAILVFFAGFAIGWIVVQAFFPSAPGSGESRWSAGRIRAFADEPRSRPSVVTDNDPPQRARTEVPSA